MAEGDTPKNTEEQVVETPQDAALSRADRQLAAMKDDNSMDRMVIRTRLAEIDRSIKDIEELIAKEKDDTKIATMNLKLADLHEARDKKHAEYKELYGELDAEADEAEAALKEISDLREDIAKQEAKAKELEATKDPAKIREAADLRKEIAEKKEQLKKLTKKDREEDLKAKRDAYRAQEEITRKEELAQAEKDLDEAAGESTNESSTEEPAAEEGKNKSPEDPDAKAALKKELLHNALHNAAFGMAVVLEKDYPGEDGNAYEKTIWTGKAFLLKVLVMFGGTPKWAELLTPKQTEFLEKKVGIQFVKEDVKKDGVPTGEKRLAVKWVKPIEGWEPGIVEMADVFETAYGKEDSAKMMEKITPDITLEELKATAPETDTSEEGAETRRLVEAMEAAGAEGGTKVQEFLTQNADKVQRNLESVAATTVAGTSKEGVEDKESETGMAKVIKLINEKKFHEGTKAKEVFMAAGDSLDLSKSPKELAEERLKSINTPEDLDRVVETSDVKAYYLAMGQEDPSLPQAVVDKARTELKGEGLTDATKAELLAGFEEGLVSQRAIYELPFKRILEGEKTLSTKAEDIKEIDVALAALKANNPTEGEKPEGQADLVIENTKISFELTVDDESTKALNYLGIGFSGNKMVGPDGAALRDFGDAKTVEVKSLGNDMFTITATTPSTVISGMPSGEKIDSVTFQGMDKVPSNIKKAEDTPGAPQT